MLELLITRCTIQYVSLCNIHNNIVQEASEGMQGVSWTTSKEYITIKQPIKYAIAWAYKARVKLMQQ